MKRLLLTLTIILSTLSLSASASNMGTPSYDKVYRTNKVGDAYQFLLLDNNGQYYHLLTNKTATLTSSELKSSKILEILKERQSWGKAFPKKGDYTINNGKFYTKLLWNPIEIISPTKIKYLNKTFYLK